MPSASQHVNSLTLCLILDMSPGTGAIPAQGSPKTFRWARDGRAQGKAEHLPHVHCGQAGVPVIPLYHQHQGQPALLPAFPGLARGPGVHRPHQRWSRGPHWGEGRAAAVRPVLLACDVPLAWSLCVWCASSLCLCLSLAVSVSVDGCLCFAACLVSLCLMFFFSVSLSLSRCLCLCWWLLVLCHLPGLFVSDVLLLCVSVSLSLSLSLLMVACALPLAWSLCGWCTSSVCLCFSVSLSLSLSLSVGGCLWSMPGLFVSGVLLLSVAVCFSLSHCLGLCLSLSVSFCFFSWDDPVWLTEH